MGALDRGGTLIAEVPGVQEAAVVAVRDEKWGERPLAFVVCEADATVGAESSRVHLMHHVEARRISKDGVPKATHIRVVDEIPKTSVGKIDRKLPRDPFA